ncbi:GNAT family N-acetyltransferase [Sulfitobacter sabulilitoris]|uniref:L-ornithine N(alpha)-acyltransferase n=1 Tax=Sulfitobacter sabulilitoris TaxID=2562655 RepID=A0A5S3PKP4_9RHOB|nr:GNAT family N-acetyltransferase [Sulfitobacter sabulilitoris]TMM54826.1 GNAT family N-acetyltransferase [Sulfitobacter sabulilitoris]
MSVLDPPDDVAPRTRQDGVGHLDGSPRFIARLTRTETDIAAAQALRARCFGLAPSADVDRFDARCDHLLIEDMRSGGVAGCCRVLSLTGADLAQSYAAQFYDLSALRHFDGPMIELGRFCVAPEGRSPDILRAAWAAITRLVDAGGVTLLFGCSSFSGIDPAPYRAAFAALAARHRAPDRWAPGIAAAEVVRYCEETHPPHAPKLAMMQMPPLLRSYLAMGGWVSDHAVVDRAMRTLHVFTGVEIAAIPAARKRLLRALA